MTSEQSHHGKWHGLWQSSLFPPSHILPHTHEAGDSYYIGDVYEPSRIGQSGEMMKKYISSFELHAPYISELVVAKVIQC